MDKTTSGTCCIKADSYSELSSAPQYCKGWVFDSEIPIFTQDREYVEVWI